MDGEKQGGLPGVTTSTSRRSPYDEDDDDDEGYPPDPDDPGSFVMGLMTPQSLTRENRRVRPAPRETQLASVRGDRQRAIIEVLRNAGRDGEVTRVISERIGYGRSNTYMTLKNLQGQGIVQMIADNPQRWRLRAGV